MHDMLGAGIAPCWRRCRWMHIQHAPRYLYSTLSSSIRVILIAVSVKFRGFVCKSITSDRIQYTTIYAHTVLHKGGARILSRAANDHSVTFSSITLSFPPPISSCSCQIGNFEGRLKLYQVGSSGHQRFMWVAIITSYSKSKRKADDLYRGSMQLENHRSTAIQYTPLFIGPYAAANNTALLAWRSSQCTKLYC